MHGRIYFDNAATTPVDPRVLEAMLPWFTERFGNPDSRTHPFGWVAEETVTRAREEVAALLGAGPNEIIFTSGATESNNLALKGAVRAAGRGRGHLVTTAIEHAAVLDPARSLAARGGDVTFVSPDRDGRIAPAAIAEAIRPDTVLVSVIHASNEIGTVQDLQGIGEVCARRGVYFHTDATQSAGKVPIDVRAAGVHLLSLSGHKMYGPKGVGALYVRRRAPRVSLAPLIEGGGQEGGLRSGTLNVPGIVGLGRAAELAATAMAEEGERIGALRDRLEGGIMGALLGAHRNGAADGRIPGISSLRFDGVDSEGLLLALPGVALSAGSACASSSLEPSHVLLALGLSREEARSAVRLSLGRFNTVEEVDRVIEAVIEAVARLRAERSATRSS